MAQQAAQLQQIIDFVLEIDRLKGVVRKTRLGALRRDENSAEHSWHAAMLAMALAPQADEAINLDRVLRMLLLHDIGEIDTGDTIVYAEGAQAQDKGLERCAVQRIFGLLPAAQRSEFQQLWEEFEQNRSADARYANAVDRLIPPLLNLHNGGVSWRENGICKQQVLDKVVGKIRPGCSAAADWLEQELERAQQQGYFTAR